MDDRHLEVGAPATRDNRRDSLTWGKDFAFLLELASQAAEMYPYVKGKAGIPFPQILKQTYEEFNHSELEVASGEVIGGSGRPLSYKISRTGNYLGIEDKQEEYFTLKAQVQLDKETGKPNTLAMLIYTKPDKKEKGKFDFLTASGHHPDFHSAKFAVFVLAFFKSCGYKIEKCLAYWNQGETNFEEFMEAFRETRDPTLSAESTWSGRLFHRLGFTETKEVEVESDHIEATFSQPEA